MKKPTQVEGDRLFEEEQKLEKKLEEDRVNGLTPPQESCSKESKSFLSGIVSFFTGGVRRKMSPYNRFDYDYVTGSAGNKHLRMWTSTCISIALQATMVLCTVGVYSLREWIVKNDSLVVYGILLSSYSKYITTALNVLQSIIFQPIIQYAHQALTELENHRTQTEHNDAAIVKASIFTFVNSYVSFFYIAFVAGNQILVLFGFPPNGDCAGYDDCMEALCYNLNAVVITSFVFHMFNELSQLHFLTRKLSDCFLPWILGESPNSAEHLRNTAKYLDKKTGEYMEEGMYLKVPWGIFIPYADQYYRFASLGNDPTVDGMLTINYSGFMKQFGYLIFFLPAYPLNAIICFFANWIEIQGDMRVLCMTLRTIPVGGQDIGSYEDVFNILVLIAVPVNTAVVVFTMNALDPIISNFVSAFNVSAYFSLAKVIVFLICQYLLFGLVSLIKWSIPSEISDIAVARERNRIVIGNMTMMDAFYVESIYAAENTNLTADNKKLQKEVKSQQKEIVAKNVTINTQNEEIVEKKVKISDQIEDIQAKTNKISEQVNLLRSYEDKINGLEYTIAQQTEIDKQKTANIDDLNRQIQSASSLS